jgi:hypothetical protein
LHSVDNFFIFVFLYQKKDFLQFVLRFTHMASKSSPMTQKRVSGLLNIFSEYLLSFQKTRYYQHCQIFLDTKYENGGKIITKLPNYHKIYQMTIIYICQHFYIWAPSKCTQIGIFGLKRYEPSGNPGYYLDTTVRSSFFQWNWLLCRLAVSQCAKGLFSYTKHKIFEIQRSSSFVSYDTTFMFRASTPWRNKKS